MKLLLSIFILCFVSCIDHTKQYLREDYGFFQQFNSYWFEEEKTAYLFFKMTEMPERIENAVWEMSYSSTGSGGETFYPFEELDFNTTVHEHQFVKCDLNSLCGSYSFHSEDPLGEVKFRMRYHPDILNLGMDISSTTLNHNKGSSYLTHSAQIYGVFDETNEHVQVRVYHNLGNPPHENISQYGMKRNFRVVKTKPEDHSLTEFSEGFTNTGSNFLFPAEFCKLENVTDVDEFFSTDKYWMNDAISLADTGRGNCLQVDYLDRNKNILMSAKSYARKNPVVEDLSFKLSTPLQEVEKIPLLLAYCQDDAKASSMTSNDYLTYQKKIMETGDAIDVCFQVGKEDDFSTQFENFISQKLTSVKATAAKDMMFSVVLHHRFTKEFRTIQKIVAEKLTALVQSDQLAVSPRLVGAMVYDSNTEYVPTLVQQKSLMWCPQELLNTPDAIAQGNYFYGQNCVTLTPQELKIEFLNFVAAMGAFPSMSQYENYVKKYQDTGIAKKPDLVLKAVETTPATLQESDGAVMVTFRDNERISLIEGENLKVCNLGNDWKSNVSFRFRFNDMPEELSSLLLPEVAVKWLSDDAAGQYAVGISWLYPFWGAVKYQSAQLNVRVAGVIPIQRSRTVYEYLGDDIWQKEGWNLGEIFKKCRAYCDHPYFDVGGNYQISKTWRTSLDCPPHKIPEWKTN